MTIILSSSPVPPSPGEHRFRQAMGCFPFVTLEGVAAMTSSTISDAAASLQDITRFPDAPYREHRVLVGTTGREELVYTLAPSAAAVTYTNSQAVALVAERNARFASDAATATPMSEQHYTATTLTNYVASVALDSSGYGIAIAATGDDPATRAIDLPLAAPLVHAFIRLVSPDGTTCDLYAVVLTTVTDIDSVAGALQDANRTLEAEGESTPSRFIAWVAEKADERYLWSRLYLGQHNALRGRLRTSHADAVPLDLSSAVATVSPHRHAQALATSIWCFDTPANYATLPRDQELPRRRLEIFARGPGRPN